MDTLKGIVSSANSIRFAHKDGLLPSMTNTLSCNQVWSNRPSVDFHHTFFTGDVVLIQVKCGLTATPLLQKYQGNTAPTSVTLSATTTYSTFKIYEYLVTLSSVEEFYYKFTTEESTWESEPIHVIESDSTYTLIQWSNLDPENDTFEFDYTTTLALANVNFMRIKSDLILAPYSGDITTYDNQNEETKIKQYLYENYTFTTEPIPGGVYRTLAIATTQDLFQINEKQYIVPEPPEMNTFGGAMEFTTTVRLPNSLGMNTDDIGYDCDSATTSNVEVKEITGATGNGSFTISAGYMVIAVVVEKVTGTPLFKAGSTVSGDEIVMEETITDTTPPAVFNVSYTPDFADSSWTLYYTLSGGTINLSVVTVPHRQ